MKLSNGKERQIFKGCLYLVLSISALWVGAVFGADGDPVEGSLGAIAQNVTSSFSNLAKLITAAAYVAGMGFAVSAVMKFKAHKDNPTQVPVGTPIALIFIAAALIFLPMIFEVSGKTIFGEDATTAGVGGTDVIPGFGGDEGP